MTRVQDAWDRLELWSRAKVLPLRADLRNGAPQQLIASVEEQLGLKLPEELGESYLRHDGQQGESTGLLFGFPLLPLKQVLEEWRVWKTVREGDGIEDLDDFEREHGSSHPDRAVKLMYSNPFWIPLSSDGRGNHLGIDLDPDEAGTPGQVINFGRDTNEKRVHAATLGEFLQRIVVELEAGNFDLEDEGHGPILCTRRAPPNWSWCRTAR